MGAMPWHIVGPYHHDLSVALAELQRQYVRENYDLSVIIPQSLTSAEECVAAVEEDDEYGLLRTYTDTLERVRAIASRPIPDDIDEQIDLLREIGRASGDAFDNILDVVKVSEGPEPWSVAPLNEEQIVGYFDTLTPSRAQAEQQFSKVYDRIDRAETVCFPVYSETQPPLAEGIMYVGYTAD